LRDSFARKRGGSCGELRTNSIKSLSSRRPKQIGGFSAFCGNSNWKWWFIVVSINE